MRNKPISNNKPISCICQRCEHCGECGYYEEITWPVISAVRAGCFEMSDPFISAIDEALEGFKCKEFEEEKK